VTKCFIGQHSAGRILIIDASDPMTSSVPSIVRDVAALIGDLLQVMSGNRSTLRLVGIIDVCSIGMFNLGDLTDAGRRRRTPSVGSDMAIGILDGSDIPGDGVVAQVCGLVVKIGVAFNELLKKVRGYSGRGARVPFE